MSSQYGVVEVAVVGLAEQFLQVLLDPELVGLQPLAGRRIGRLHQRDVEGEFGPRRAALGRPLAVEMELAQRHLGVGRGRLAVGVQPMIGDGRPLNQDQQDNDRDQQPAPGDEPPKMSTRSGGGSPFGPCGPFGIRLAALAIDAICCHETALG